MMMIWVFRYFRGVLKFVRCDGYSSRGWFSIWGGLSSMVRLLFVYVTYPAQYLNRRPSRINIAMYRCAQGYLQV